MSAHTNQHSETSTQQHQAGPWQVIVESNLLNALILALAIIYLGNKFLPKIINQRKKQISKELEEAKIARIKASEELDAVKEKTERVLSEVEEIKAEAKKTAQTIKTQIEQETGKELEQIKLKIQREISSSWEEAVQSIKQTTANTAVKLAEEALSKLSKNEEVQKKLTSDFLAHLDRPSKN